MRALMFTGNCTFRLYHPPSTIHHPSGSEEGRREGRNEEEKEGAGRAKEKRKKKEGGGKGRTQQTANAHFPPP